MTGKWNVSQLAAMTAQPVRDAKVIHFLAVHDHLRSNWRGGTALELDTPSQPRPLQEEIRPPFPPQ
ncbi:hypothetical protein PDE_08377 [Penicillium oxalicum 114-2]|uniref:Uncharacterized protein n=1 Tax=Penicillium oxalicum (strain 114-2 / CGMCC 5302) TaxID=933388 RepID=S7ZRR0_PENO1|nr:hypothetical protein PDE_08377 [Penicillium oxalicum 114-2]